MGYLQDYYDKNKKQNPMASTSSTSSGGYLSQYQQKNKLKSPFEVAPIKKVETKPLPKRPIVQPVKTTQKPVEKSLLDKAKGFVGKVVEKADDLLRGRPKIVSPVPTKKDEDVGAIETTARQFKAGTGDLLYTAGSTAKWLGKDGVASKLQQQGMRYQSVAVDKTTGDFTPDDLFDPAFYTQTLMRAVPFTVALLPAAIVGGYAAAGTAGALGLGALATTVLGSIGAAGLSRPLEGALEAGSAYDQAIQEGMTPEKAREVANKTFKGNLALTGLDATEFFLAFVPLKGGGRFVKALQRTAGVAGGIAMEGSEEVIQSNIQRLAMDKDIDITSKQAQEEFAIGGIMGGGMSVAGAIYTKIQTNVEEEYKEEYDEKLIEKVNKGVEPDVARIQALDEIAESHPKEVQEIVESTLEQTIIPPQGVETSSSEGTKEVDTSSSKEKPKFMPETRKMLAKNMEKAQNKFGEEARIEDIGREWGDFAPEDQPNMAVYEDRRTDKSKDGIEVVGEIIGTSHRNGDVAVYLVDNPSGTVGKEVETFTKNVKKYTSAEDFADAEFSATPDQQAGMVDASTIESRDPFEKDSKEYIELKAQIEKDGMILEPVRVTVEEGQKPITTEGSKRTAIAEDLGIPLPVIVNEGSIEGLQTIAEIYESGIMESNDKGTTDIGIGEENQERVPSSPAQVGDGGQGVSGEPTAKPSRQVAQRERGGSDGVAGERSTASVKELKSKLADYEQRKRLFSPNKNLGIDNTSQYDRLIEDTKAEIAELEKETSTPVKKGDQNFTITLKSGETVEATYNPNYFESKNNPAEHIEFRGEATSPTGYKSDFFRDGIPDGMSVEEFVTLRAEMFAEEEANDRKKNKKTPKVSKIENIVENELPQEIQDEVEEQLAEVEGDPVKEEAVINKARKKATELTEPVIQSTKQQVQINKEIEELMANKAGAELTDAEKKLVKQYSGSGGLESAGAEGRGLLDEYFTPKPIVDFMWDKVTAEIKVSKDSTILEPAVGIGAFLERVPKGARKMAFEINPTSANITRALHGDNLNMNIESFESLFISKRGEKYPVKEFADVVIGNPPYGEHRGKYLGLGEEPKIIKYEEYFMKRGMDVLNPDGVMAFVVPSGFLRSGTSHAKVEIAKQGRLISAYRLPEGSFGTTTIGTDVLIFKKSLDGTDAASALLDLMSDNYFFDNSDRILGTVSKGTGRYGQDQVIGSLESAIRMARSDAVEIEDSMTAEEVQEDVQEMTQEIAEAVEETKAEPVSVSRSPVKINKANKKAQIIPSKKDKILKLNSASGSEIAMWKEVTVTGELSPTYTSSFTPKSFQSSEVALDMADNTPRYYPNVLYYQGDIYDKLDTLEIVKDKMNPKQYALQKSKLQEILPEPQKIEDIRLSPIADFVKEIKFEVDGQANSVVDLFRSYIYNLPYSAFGSSSAWEVRAYLAGQVVNSGNKLQNIEIRKRRRDVTNSLFNRFMFESLTSEQRQFLADRYNRTFNAYFRPDYKQVPVLSDVNATFKGEKLEVKDIQKEGAAFLATKGSGLLGYDVGVGKTLTAIISINDVMKRGWAKKPLIIVPNGVYKNWISEISDIVPGVKINDLSNLGAGFKGDLKTLEIEDGTLSIITYSGLVKLGFKDETYQKLTVDLQDVMSGMNTTKRGAAKQEAQAEQQIGRAIKGTSDVRFFEDLGFDHLTIDEVHNFKNIFAGAKIPKGTGNEFRNVRGSSSARGIKAYLMAQYVMQNNNDRNVFLLSATPFTNSPLEIYSIMSLMGKKRLEQIGLKNVNDFMTMFMELKPTFVVKADQSVKEEDVIEKFQNLQQLQKLVTEFIDFRTGEEAGVDRPERIKRTITLNPDPLQEGFMAQAQPLFTDKQNGGAIVAITELQNTALSPYLSRFNTVQPTYKQFVENSPKIKYAIEGIAQNKKDNPGAGQVLYMPRGIQYFNLVREYLVKEKGFKQTDIAEITGGMSLDARMKAQTGFNEGKIKVLIGTEAIKEGVNLQERSTDLFHLHLPWNPTDMLQVEGRIWRQGNKWKNVRIHYPLIENSVDSFIFQKLETKEKRIKNLWSYKTNEINVGDLNFEEMKLDLITDPALRVNAEKTFETSKIRQKKEQLNVELAFTQRRIKALTEAKEDYESAKSSFDNAKADEDMDESRLDWYKTRVSKAKGELTRLENILKASKMTVKDVSAKEADLTKQIAEQVQISEGLEEKFAKKLAEAKEEKIQTGVKTNNFKSLISDIAKENKTFFVEKMKAQKKPSGDFKIKVDGKTEVADGKTEVRIDDLDGKVNEADIAKSPEDLKKKIEQLNKFAQANAILRRTGGLASKKAGGQFVKPGKSLFKKGVAKEGQVRLRAENIANDSEYVSILAHELGHAIEFTITGDTGKRTFNVFGDDLSTATVQTLKDELMAITIELEGASTVEKNKKYYEKPAELLARFFEKMIVSPGNLIDIAPTAKELIEKQSIKHPMIEEFLETVEGNIDKGTFTKIPSFYRDLRQTYQKHLGVRVGNIYYGEELAHRAMQERAKVVMKDLIDTKFKKVKDDAGLLFRAAESIKVSKGGVPEFGTRDFATATTDEEIKNLQDMGFEEVTDIMKDGEIVPMYAKPRYTEEQGRALFNQLSKEGKQLILDFTASREEAKDYFNREIIKDLNKVEGNIEGWVHHYFEDESQSKGGKRLKFREASSRKKRTGKEGFVEDFKKAMSKALIDLEMEKVTNDFLPRFFAGVTKPIPEGQKAEAGYIEVVGSLDKGVGTQQEKKMVIIQDGKSFIAKQTRYQMPSDIYERYKLLKGLADEASLATRVVSDINRYWRINILAHPGTAATNFVSGGIQYSTKVLTDFYTETLTGNITYKKTRQNVSAMLKVLTPKGWSEAEDWVYGADLSNYYGQFTKQPTTSKAISAYGDKALKLFSVYERYWKKVIATSEGGRTLAGLNKIGKEGLRLPTKEERILLAEINQQVDLYAYDYDNIPVWLTKFGKNPLAQSVKPFAVYPYKYAKHFTNMAGSIFDRSLPWQERTAKLLALSTIVALYAMYSDERRKKQETPEGTENTPVRMSPKGRLFITKKDGKEIFTRISKYPFINLSATGSQLVNGEFEAATDLLSEMFGSIAPIGKLALLGIGYRSKYETYDSVPVIVGNNLSTYLPFYRIFSDVSRMLDPFQRKQSTFLQTFTKVIPTTDKDLQDKLHGEARTERIPIEGDVKGQEGTKRTTIDKTLKNYWQDIAISMLTGIYTTRIDPVDARAFMIRSEKNAEEKNVTSKIDEYVSKYKNKPSISTKMKLERELIESVVGKPPYNKERQKERESVRKRFRTKIKAK